MSGPDDTDSSLGSGFEALLRAIARGPESPVELLRDPDLAPGSRVGRYEVIRLMGRGGMGAVYRARDDLLGRDVALKVILMGATGSRVDRFRREIVALASVRHENVVSVYDAGVDGALPYVVLDLVEGQTLRQRLTAGALGVVETLKLARDLARGLGAAHSVGIVHRDLKPENVLLDSQGTAKLVDFGLARLVERADAAEHGRTESGVFLGTAGYMAPEQVRGEDVDQRADFFALGAVLFEALTGRYAFDGASRADVLTAVLRDQPATPPALLADERARRLLEVTFRCLEKAPERRFQFAAEILDALDAASEPGSQPAAPRGHQQTAASLAGRVLGRYRLERLLGEGGMGVVYAARHQELGKPAAVKVLHERHDSEQIRARFLREGQAASRIRHPNIVDVYDVGSDGGRAYLVMELLEGEDLRSLIEREAPLSAQRTADLLVPVISALAAAHELGVVHRDLKPDNIFLCRERTTVTPKVLDFGISKVADEEKALALTGTGTVLGTPFYMSPEQAQASKDIDLRSDQYSIGVILYECATGKRPVEETSIYALIQRIVHGEFTPPRQVNPNIPAAFEQLILQAMAQNPADRFPSMRALGCALLGFASERLRADYLEELAHERAPREAAVASGANRTIELGTTLRQSVHARESVQKPAGNPRFTLPRLGALAAALAAGVFVLVTVLGRVRQHDPVTASATSPISSSPVPRVSVLDLPRPATASSAAAAAYLAGLRAERDWDYDDAVRSMRESLQADPDLAAAAFRLGVFLIVHQPNEARTAFASASRLKDRLSPRDAAVLDAVRPWFSVPSDPGAAGDALARLEPSYPGDAELLMLRGAAYFVVGRDADAVGVLQRSLAADPAFAYASLHLAAALAALDKIDEARAVAQRCIQRSATASSCWRISFGLAHETGNRRECEELSLGAMAANPRAARHAFWYVDTIAASESREKVTGALERWLALEDAAMRSEDEARARALLDVLDGNFGAALPVLSRLPATTQSPRFRMFAYEPTWLLVLEEIGRLDELKRVALRLTDQVRAELQPTVSGSSILARIEPDLIRALLVAGAHDEAAAEREQRALEQAWVARAPSLSGLVWVRTRASLVDSPSAAERALEALPAHGPPNYLNASVLHLHVGKTYFFAGRLEQARRWLERAAGSCTTLSAPVTWLRSHYWLGRTLEAGGGRERACAAYAAVIGRWGQAKPPSRTASDARKAASALGCR